MDEVSYVQGNKQAYLNILNECLKHLGTEFNHLNSAIERQEAINSLRNLCDKFGDNDWPDSLHLVDIIEKHLANYLWEKMKNERFVG